MLKHNDETDESFGGPFNQAEHHREKYEREVTYWKQEDFEKRYSLIVCSIGKTLGELQRDFQESYGTTSDVDGVVIYGSWARSRLEDKVWVHDQSDLDIVLLTREDVGDLPRRFKSMLSQHLKGHLPVEVFGAVRYTDRERELLSIQNSRSLLHVDQPAIVIISKAIPDAHQQITDFIREAGFTEVRIELA